MSNQDMQQQQDRTDRGYAIAAIIQAVPLVLYVSVIVLVFGFILMALLLNHDAKTLETFTSQVLLWLVRLLIAAGIVLLIIGLYKCYRLYHTIHLDVYERRAAKALAQKQMKQVERLELQNLQLRSKIAIEQQLASSIEYFISQGHNVEYGKDGLKFLSRQAVTEIASPASPGGAGPAMIAGPSDLPTNVLYDDIRQQVPRGHVLVGIGRAGVETKEGAVGACVWIVGLSGTGKTSTTVLRVEERHTDGHKFLGIDPHWFKPDSLTNAITAYASSFIKPMARTPEETNEVLNAFLTEFYGRKAGTIPQPWQKITLLVDEVGAMMDPTTKLEEENAELLTRIARICGQEARNFGMGGVFISQQATGLAWLRKVALMIIVHQLLMESEKKLALNGDKVAMEDMKHWPIGRTYVFGVGFQEGPRTVQQPYFTRAGSPGDHWQYDESQGDNEHDESQAPSPEQQNTDEIEGLPVDESLREALEAWHNGATGPRAMERALGCTYYQAQKLCNELVKNGYVESD